MGGVSAGQRDSDWTVTLTVGAAFGLAGALVQRPELPEDCLCKPWRFSHFRFNVKKRRKEIMQYSFEIISNLLGWNTWGGGEDLNF